MKKQVDKYGNIYYYNDKNQLHREDGPAIEYSNGTKYWFLNGKEHRTDGPAVEDSDGSKEWFINGVKTTCCINCENPAILEEEFCLYCILPIKSASKRC